MSSTHGPEQAILTYGVSEKIASSKAAWPLIRIEGLRVTTIGLAIWGISLEGLSRSHGYSARLHWLDGSG
jgi:hypothetical protein